ncbi:MAG: hypothetical protein ACI9ON_004163 [Limisphaerales bacterium]|jgi:hypothetical protein
MKLQIYAPMAPSRMRRLFIFAGGLVLLKDTHLGYLVENATVYVPMRAIRLNCTYIRVDFLRENAHSLVSRKKSI